MVNVGRTNRTVIKMCSNRTSQKSKAGLRNGAISLTLGIVSIIFAISIISRTIWGLLFVAAAPVALIGLFFGGIGLNSRGRQYVVAGEQQTDRCIMK
jgi:hypothetical protein